MDVPSLLSNQLKDRFSKIAYKEQELGFSVESWNELSALQVSLDEAPEEGILPTSLSPMVIILYF